MKDKTIKLMVDAIQAQMALLEDVPDIMKAMLNLIEHLVEKTEKLGQENQQLKNEISKLKGETVPPNVRKQTTGKKPHSSESDRKKRTKKTKTKSKKGGSKKSTVKVNKIKKLTIDNKGLPAGAKRAGIKTTVVQDIIFTTENIAFKRQMYFSKSENKYYTAPLPAGHEGEYGPALKLG